MSKSRRKITKCTIAFWITYATLSIALCVGIAIGLDWLNRFLADYEAHDEERFVKAFMEELKAANYEQLLECLVFTPTVFEGAEVYRNAYLAGIQEEPGYSRNLKLSTDEKPVYVVKSGKNQIAELYFKMSEEVSEFGFRAYEIDKIVTGEIETGNISVSAPNTVEVFINGVKLDDSYVVETSPPFENVKYFYDYIEDPPYMVTYEVEGLLNEPEITALLNGTELVMDEYNTFHLPTVVDEELYEIAINFSLEYSKYIAGDTYFNKVGDHIPRELKLYDDLYHYFNIYYDWHYGYDFENIVADNLIFYTPDCFSVNVKYDHIVYSSEAVSFPANNTIYFVRIDDKWKVTELVME